MLKNEKFKSPENANIDYIWWFTAFLSKNMLEISNYKPNAVIHSWVELISFQHKFFLSDIV